jgi:hypothetical protein
MSAMRTAKVTLAAGLGLISLLERVVNKTDEPTRGVRSAVATERKLARIGDSADWKLRPAERCGLLGGAPPSLGSTYSLEGR